MAPRRRHDVLLSSAVASFERGDVATALLAAECVCRSHPGLGIAAVLRARIVQDALPALAAAAWHEAWRRDPEQPLLQDILLRALLADGAHARAAALGTAFLAGRCRSGSQTALVALLRQAGATYFGACWKDGDAIAAMLFAPPGVARAGLRLHGAHGVSDYEVPADGRMFRLPRPQGGGALSLLAVAPAGTVMLAGSPLSFDTVPVPVAVPVPARCAAAVPPRPVAVVVPVYRGLDDVRRCIDSVLASLPANRKEARLLAIDDASPEPELAAWLDAQAQAGRLTLLRNPYNLGFIETVNRALRACPDEDALLLNADTVVHGDWIDRLAAALDGAPDIAAVSPWSNNGEITSFPAIGRAAPMPDGAAVRRIDMAAAALRRAGACLDVDLPACCGFAMLMRRAVIDRIGVLDGTSLQRGYGEEVDWCLRARAAGFRILAATGVYVAHAGGVSFGGEKALRVRQNRAVLAARYPDYYDQYRHFLRSDPLAAARAALARALRVADGAVAPDRPAASAVRPGALPGQCVRIGVWTRTADDVPGAAVLRLARLLARRDPALPPVRVLVLGAVSEAFWHTGAVDALPRCLDADADVLFDDAALLGLAGCTVLLAAPDVTVPAGIATVRLDADFDPAAWLAGWLDRRAASPFATL